MKNVVIITGAGISAESGISTFRDANGLWKGHNIQVVASPAGWRNDPNLVLQFYNQRRRQLLEVSPNAAHFALSELAHKFETFIITQNVDNLHEQAGNKEVLHLHGELLKARSTKDESLVYDWLKDIEIGDLCELGSQLRPHIVWFGEEVPAMGHAIKLVMNADALMVVGTSMQVYPAASLIDFAKPAASILFIDPSPSSSLSKKEYPNLTVFAEKATTGVPKAIALLEKLLQ